MRTPYINSELPRDIKAYFYPNCAEFSELDNTSRFIEISLALHNGLNLYDAITMYIADKEEMSETSEFAIKKTLCEFVVELRFATNVNAIKEKDVEYSLLIDNLSLKESTELFSNELMQRFFYKDKNGEIECFQKFITYKSPLFLYKKCELSKEDFIAQVTHPTGWKSVCEGDLRKSNPWKRLADKYYGYKLYDPSKTFAIEEDLPMLESFNNGEVAPQCKYHLEIPAEPWGGNPLTADIIILSLNPGWKEECNKNEAIKLEHRPSISESIFAEKRNTLLLNVRTFMPMVGYGATEEIYKEFNKLGDNYWEHKLSWLRNAVPEIDDTDFYHKFALVQYCAYTSEKYGAGFGCGNYLPSQLFTKEIIRYVAYNRPNTKFVIFRAIDKWKELLDEDVWYTILPRLIVGNSYRQQTLSPTNLGEANFQALVDIVKKSSL